MSFKYQISPILLLAMSACSDVEKADEDVHEHELITTVVLHFTNTADETDMLQVRWNEGDDKGEEIVLQNGSDYTLSLEILNEEEEPTEDVTPEIAQEEDEHQVFFTGDAVDGPCMDDNPEAFIEHAYADEDANGLPIGLENTISTLAVGSTDGDYSRKNGLVVTLRHLAYEDGQRTKVAGLADQLVSGGFSSLPGANDFSVIYPVVVE